MRSDLRPVCRACGHSEKFDFYVPDDIWQQVVPPEHQRGVICLECFDEFAFDKGVDYSQSIGTLYFAGDQAVLEFRKVAESAS
jgi:hypothetical protein